MKIIFNETKYNRYSINSLIAVLEHQGLLDKFKFEIFNLDSKKINKNENDLLIFCYSFCTPQLFTIRESIKRVRESYPEAILIAGGPHPSGVPEDTLNLGFDYVIVGEGEKIFPELISNLKNSTLKNKVIKAEKVDMDKYPSWSDKYSRFFPIEITRGCPFACKFCQTSFLFGTKPRHRSIESIINYVEKFFKSGKRDLRFITPNALSYGSEDGKNIDLKKVEMLLKSIRSISESIRIFFGTFPSELRPEHVTKDALDLIKGYIFNKTLTIGAQSGSEKILEKINRGHTVDDVYNAVRNAVERGFSVNVDFIFGLPEETEKDQRDTINFMEKITDLGHKNNISVKIHTHYFMPLPGTPLYNRNPSKLSRELTNYLSKLYNSKNIFGEWDKQRIYTEKLIYQN